MGRQSAVNVPSGYVHITPEEATQLPYHLLRVINGEYFYKGTRKNEENLKPSGQVKSMPQRDVIAIKPQEIPANDPANFTYLPSRLIGLKPVDGKMFSYFKGY